MTSARFSGVMICLMIALTFIASRDAMAQRPPMAEQDSLALVAMYHSLNGHAWVNQGGWLQEGVPAELWEGVTRVQEVDGVLRIERMQLPFNNMTIPGTLPPEFGDLDFIDNIRFSNDLIMGEVPDEVRKWSRMHSFRIDNQLLSGELPYDALLEAGVRRIQLQDNHFLTGDIPEEIGDHPAVETLHLHNNQLVGTLPPSLNNLTNMTNIVVSGNRLSGPIPDLSALQNMNRFEVDFNNFDEGPVPDWIQNLSGVLQRLYLDGTNRTGEIPSWITDMEELRMLKLGGGDEIGGDMANIPNMEFMSNMQQLYLQEGNWYGEVPEWLGYMPLVRLWLTDNALTGTIPATLGGMENLVQLGLAGNQITGPLPEELSAISTLQLLSLEGNPLELGEIPTWFGEFNLSNLNLRNTGLTGSIPDYINYDNLGTLTLANNDLTGDVPQWLKDKDLGTLNLSYTNLNIPAFPEWLESWTMSSLHLQGLGMTGPIPDWLADNNPFMRQLSLNDNQLSGPIPSNFGNWFLLDSLNLANNLLEGEFPASLADMGRISDEHSLLTAVSFAGNPGLTGDLPEGFMRTNFLRVFEFEGTGLCAPDDEFEEWLENTVPANAELFYPPRYTSVSINTDGCGPTNAEIEKVFGFILQQNYPNPFNPSTTIKYEIPSDFQVSLHVYNVLGQRVATLVNTHQSAGSYEVTFDAARLASGMYIYRLEAGNRVQTKSMMVLK